MSSRNGEVEAVLKELSIFGIKGRILPLAKHLAVTWALPDGRTRSQVCAKTGSDWRGTLNARAHVRRMLKEDGVVPPSPEKRVLEKALSLPQPSETGDARLTRLEQDNEALLDWVFELQESVKVLQHMLANATATVTLNFATPKAETASRFLSEEDTVAEGQFVAPRTAATALPEKKQKQLSQPELVLSILSSGSWKHLHVIEKAVNAVRPMKRATLGTVLSKLKKEGLIVNGQRCNWRLSPDTRINGTALTTNSLIKEPKHGFQARSAFQEEREGTVRSSEGGARENQ